MNVDFDKALYDEKLDRINKCVTDLVEFTRNSTNSIEGRISKLENRFLMIMTTLCLNLIGVIIILLKFSL